MEHPENLPAEEAPAVRFEAPAQGATQPGTMPMGNLPGRPAKAYIGS